MVPALNRGADHLPALQIPLLAKAPNQKKENEMKRFILAAALCCILVFSVTAKGGRCLNPSVEAQPAVIAVGESIQVVAHFNNCGGTNLSNVGTKVYAYPAGTYDYIEVIPYTLISSIKPGQTVTLTATFTPPYPGEWELLSQMHPSALWAYAEADFTVTP